VTPAQPVRGGARRASAPRAEALPEGHRWWRLADASWANPLDPTWADVAGGRWNAPGDGPTLYLNGDVLTARAQVARLLAGSPIDPEDLADDAPFVLVPVRLPARQRVADAHTDTGLAALGLPTTYPRARNGAAVPWARCRTAAAAVRAAGLRGVRARSAAPAAGLGGAPGDELAWFPAPRAHALPDGARVPFARWRHASDQGPST
jgi:hypothetical protein